MNANKQQILDEITRKRAMWLNAIEQQEKGWKSQKLNGSRSLSGEQCDAIRELEDEVKKTHDDYHDYCRKTLDELLDGLDASFVNYWKNEFESVISQSHNLSSFYENLIKTQPDL